MKPGSEDTLRELLREFEARQVPGFVAHYTYRLDADPNTIVEAVIFASKEAYVANANSPEQHTFYERMAALFDGEPEWQDGEIVHARHAAS
jgi:quinol monooxygenase YgiN